MTKRDRFSAYRWQARPDVTPPVELRVGPALDPDVVREAATLPVEVLCERMGMPPGDVVVVDDEARADEEFTIVLSGATRFAGSTAMEPIDWWVSRPVAGQYGRTGTVAPAAGPDASAMLVGRAVEEALWADPSVLWSQAASGAIQAGWGDDGNLDAEQAQHLHALLRELAARRIALTDRDHLRDSIEAIGLATDRTRLIEQVSSELSPATVDLHLGPGLSAQFDAVEWETALQQTRERVFNRLGVAFPAVRVHSHSDQPDRQFQVTVNELPRATGRIPPDRSCMWLLKKPSPEDPAAEPCVHPTEGSLWHWVEPSGSWIPIAQLSTTEFLAVSVEACLGEAAAEFADLAWCGRLLDRIEHSRGMLITWLRERFQDEVVSAVGRGLVNEGISLRLLPLVLERLLQFYDVPPAQVIDAADSVMSITWAAENPVALLEHARSALKAHLIHQHRPGYDGGAIDAIVLDPEVEAALRIAARRNSDPWVVGRGSHARLILTALRDRPAEAAHLPIVTALDLRSPLRRLIAAQFPGIGVLARTDLPSSAVVRPAHVIASHA